MTAEEIRLLRLANQHLTAPADKLTVVRDLCGIQAQFLSNAIHAMRIRCAEFSIWTASSCLRFCSGGRWKKQGSKLTVELFEPLENTDRAKIRDAAESMWNGITKLEWK